MAYYRRLMSHRSATSVLLNLGHAFDHLFLLIFASAVSSIAAGWHMAWPDLMPYSTGAFVAFGLGALPAGRLGDLWGRRAMMIVFFAGLGVSGVGIALAQGPRSLAVALTLMGVFASIYHPVGIPMLVERSTRPGFTIGLNGLVGNLGIAVAAALTGYLVEHLGWRWAFAVPSVAAIGCAIAFAVLVPEESEAPAKRPPTLKPLPPNVLARVLSLLTLASISGGFVFNFTTNGNGQLLAERMKGVVDDPSELGLLLALVYALASFAQIVVGKLIDRHPVKRIYLPVLAAQVPLFLLASRATGWSLYAAVLGFMIFVFGAVPFIDALIVQYIDDQKRSRVAGARLAVSFGASSGAVYLLGPLVKDAGFATLLVDMAILAAVSMVFVAMLPGGDASRAPIEPDLAA